MSLRPPALGAAPIFTLAERAQVIVQGTVEGVKSYKDGTILVFTIRPLTVLKGAAQPGTPILLVQDVLFASQPPNFTSGTTTLVFCEPLPDYSLYREALPPGSYWRWPEPKDRAADLAPLRDPSLVAPLAGYLEVRADRGATARYLAGLLTASEPRLRGDALAAFEARPELVPFLDEPTLTPLAAFLRRDDVPVADRAQVLIVLAHLHAPGLAPVAEPLAAEPGPLQSAAIDALLSLGRVPTERHLLTYARSQDAALRLVAARGLARTASPEAMARLQEMLASDPSREVRIAALTALGESGSDRAVPLLAGAFASRDRGEIHAAAIGLGQIASPAAVGALSDVVLHGSFEAQTMAVFALNKAGTTQAIRFLREQLETHPNPEIRRTIKVALGGAPEEHE